VARLCAEAGAENGPTGLKNSGVSGDEGRTGKVRPFFTKKYSAGDFLVEGPLAAAMQEQGNGQADRQ